MRHILLLFFAAMLSSCSGLHQASFDHAFAKAVIENNTRGIFANCTPRNASFPLNGTPPIYYAASYGNERAIDLLYNQGASLGSRSPEGKSLVYAAAANGHSTTARKLLALNAGTQSDLSLGASDHRQQLAANARAEKLQMAALAWFVAAIASSGNSGGGNGESKCWRCGAPGSRECSSCRGAVIAASRPLTY
jgi:hypothetical protein